jgi:serine/threonine protein kinase
MKAIDELMKDKGHPNIISVLQHSWYGHPYSFYCIDMELCDMSLHYYIHGERRYIFHDTAVAVSNDAPLPKKMLNIWTIMFQITQGLAFIHSHKQVHRDLKPRNSMFLFKFPR